jgi:AraC-like DNA-binding protein
MLLKDFKPSAAISDYVHLFRIVHFLFGPHEVLPFKAYPPRPEHCLAFYPYDTENIEYTDSGKKITALPVVLYGQQLAVTNRYIGREFLVFQIVFHPGALYCITGIPATELNNEYIDAEIVFSTAVKEINEQLYHALNYMEMIAIVEKFISSLISKCRKDFHPVDAMSKLLIQHGGNLSIDTLAAQSYLSFRQFERKFKERTGVNPKLLSRVSRFDKAFRLKNLYPQMDWLRIAIECNYYDYQHLVKDYKDFTGMTPAAFHEIENKAPERNFGLTETYYDTAI